MSSAEPQITILLNESSENFLQHYPQVKKFKRNSPQQKTFNQKLFNYFLLNDNGALPTAAVTALAENYPAKEGWWLRADPVHLHVDMSHIYLVGNQHLDFSDKEITQLVTELNQFLKEDNLQLLVANKTEWYLQLAQNPEIETFPLTEVIGKIITNYLPQGKNSGYWKKLLTEIQMLLELSEVNKNRKAENKAIINSVWFWGEGKLPQVIEKPVWKKVYGNDPLTKGLTLLTKIPYEDFSGNFNFLEEITSGEYLIIDSRGAPLAGPFLTALFGHASGALLRKTKAKIILDFANGDLFELNSKQLRSWWQRIF